MNGDRQDPARIGPRCGCRRRMPKPRSPRSSTASGLPLAQCEAYPQTLGGGFGRRGGTQDYVRAGRLHREAVPSGLPSSSSGAARKIRAHDFLSAHFAMPLQAGLDAERQSHRACTFGFPGNRSTLTLNPAGIEDGKDMRQLQGYYESSLATRSIGYSIPNLRIEYAMRNTHVPVGPWRGVNTNQNGVYMECFMDEVAKAAGKDPLEFRRALMNKHPKHLAVLNAAAERGGWGKPLPLGGHRGHRAVHGLWQLLGCRGGSLDGARARSKCTAWFWRSIAATL